MKCLIRFLKKQKMKNKKFKNYQTEIVELKNTMNEMQFKNA